MIEAIFGALGSGYFWLGIIPGIFIGGWAIRQTREYRAFQESQNREPRYKPFDE